MDGRTRRLPFGSSRVTRSTARTPTIAATNGRPVARLTRPTPTSRRAASDQMDGQRSELALANLGLARSRAILFKRRTRTLFELDDLISEAFVGLLQAAARWN